MIHSHIFLWFHIKTFRNINVAYIHAIPVLLGAVLAKRCTWRTSELSWPLQLNRQGPGRSIWRRRQNAESRKADSKKWKWHSRRNARNRGRLAVSQRGSARPGDFGVYSGRMEMSRESDWSIIVLGLFDCVCCIGCCYLCISVKEHCKFILKIASNYIQFKLHDTFKKIGYRSEYLLVTVKDIWLKYIIYVEKPSFEIEQIKPLLIQNVCQIFFF